jgi:hypothetical protein
MRKKIVLLAMTVMMALTASAQFEEGKSYIGASFTGLDFNYSGSSKFSGGMSAQVGYFFLDDLMLLAEGSYQRNGVVKTNDFTFGVGGRYYIEQNGIYLGANLKYLHNNHNYNDVLPGVEVGYAFFIDGHVTVEPALYYQQSFKNHSDYSKVGFRIGFGYTF